MAIDPAIVTHVAGLARLALTDDEKALLGAQLARIVEHFQALRAAAIDGVPTTSHVLAITNVLRDDVATPSLSRDEILESAPAHDGGFFVVPPIFDSD